MIASGGSHYIPGLGYPALPLRGVASGDARMVNTLDSGALQITGDTVNTGMPETPVGRRVRLHDQPSGRVVAEQWTDPVTGVYSFTRLRPGTFYVTAFDHTGQFNGVISSDLTPDPMP